jgi:hypothetical protein
MLGLSQLLVRDFRNWFLNTQVGGVSIKGGNHATLILGVSSDCIILKVMDIYIIYIYMHIFVCIIYNCMYIYIYIYISIVTFKCDELEKI